MSQQTVKRPIDSNSYSNDDLNNEDYDATWGGKRSRYLYNYTTLELPEELSNTDDSDQTESILSVQTKSTKLLSEEDKSSSHSSCESDCQKSEDSNRSDLTEFEVVTSSSSESDCFKDDFTSDSSSDVNYEVPNIFKILNEPAYSSDNEYCPDDKQETIISTSLPPPACFKTCLQCKKENPNPYFQYCFTCFRNRMDFFTKKPDPKHKIKNRSNRSNYKNKLNSQDAGVLVSQKLEIGTQKEDNSQNGKTSKPENLDEYTKDLCSICLIMPKNGIFNHGKIGHIYSCYQCAKNIKRISNRCPICNVKVQYVTKMITV